MAKLTNSQFEAIAQFGLTGPENGRASWWWLDFGQLFLSIDVVTGPRIGFQIPFNPRFHIATVDVENAPERERRGFARLTF